MVAAHEDRVVAQTLGEVDLPVDVLRRVVVFVQEVAEISDQHRHVDVAQRLLDAAPEIGGDVRAAVGVEQDRDRLVQISERAVRRRGRIDQAARRPEQGRVELVERCAVLRHDLVVLGADRLRHGNRIERVVGGEHAHAKAIAQPAPEVLGNGGDLVAGKPVDPARHGQSVRGARLRDLAGFGALQHDVGGEELRDGRAHRRRPGRDVRARRVVDRAGLEPRVERPLPVELGQHGLHRRRG